MFHSESSSWFADLCPSNLSREIRLSPWIKRLHQYIRSHREPLPWKSSLYISTTTHSLLPGFAILYVILHVMYLLFYILGVTWWFSSEFSIFILGQWAYIFAFMVTQSVLLIDESIILSCLVLAVTCYFLIFRSFYINNNLSNLGLQKLMYLLDR